MEVPGRRPVERPKKNLRCIEEDMEDLGIEEDTWRTETNGEKSSPVQPHKENRMKNKDDDD